MSKLFSKSSLAPTESPIRNLDNGFSQATHKIDGTNSLEGTSEVVGLGLALLPANTLIDSLVGKREGVVVVGRIQGFESEEQSLISLRRVGR